MLTRPSWLYVYSDNIHDPNGNSAWCPGCGRRLIERDGYELGEWQLKNNCRTHCGCKIAGHFEARPGLWGNRRLPVRLGWFNVWKVM